MQQRGICFICIGENDNGKPVIHKTCINRSEPNISTTMYN